MDNNIVGKKCPLCKERGSPGRLAKAGNDQSGYLYECTTKQHIFGLRGLDIVVRYSSDGEEDKDKVFPISELE